MFDTRPLKLNQDILIFFIIERKMHFCKLLWWNQQHCWSHASPGRLISHTDEATRLLSLETLFSVFLSAFISSYCSFTSTSTSCLSSIRVHPHQSVVSIHSEALVSVLFRISLQKFNLLTTFPRPPQLIPQQSVSPSSVQRDFLSSASLKILFLLSG